MTRAKAIFILLAITVSYSYAQKSNPYSGEPKANPILQFLSKFTISGSIGYGATFHNHKITGVGLINNPNGDQNENKMLFSNFHLFFYKLQQCPVFS